MNFLKVGEENYINLDRVDVFTKNSDGWTSFYTSGLWSCYKIDFKEVVKAVSKNEK